MHAREPIAGCRLRPFRRDEVELYHLWMASEEVCGPYVELENQPLEELLREFDATGWQTEACFRCIYESPGGEPMGYAHWWRCDRYEPHMEFGRILLPRFRGKNLGTEFLRAILTRVFSTCPTRRVQAITCIQNQPVLDQWQTVGIRVEGRLKEFMTLRGSYVDCYLGAILRNEWKERSLHR